MMNNHLDCQVEPDCAPDDSEIDISPQPGYTPSHHIGVRMRQPNTGGVLLADVERLGVSSRRSRGRSSGYSSDSVSGSLKGTTAADCDSVTPTCQMGIETANQREDCEKGITQITDDMIEDGAHVVFDWDNTLKLYDTHTRQLSTRVDREFLLHLKRDRHCKLYIISALTPSAINLSTILCEIEKLGLTDVFVNVGFKPGGCDQVDGLVADRAVVEGRQYAYKGNVIICGYDKAETFLKLSSFDASNGDRVVFFDDESVNVDNFRAIVPNSDCYLCK